MTPVRSVDVPTDDELFLRLTPKGRAILALFSALGSNSELDVVELAAVVDRLAEAGFEIRRVGEPVPPLPPLLDPLLDALNKLSAIPTGHDNQFENATHEVLGIFGNLPDSVVGPKRGNHPEWVVVGAAEFTKLRGLYDSLTLVAPEDIIEAATELIESAP